MQISFHRPDPKSRTQLSPFQRMSRRIDRPIDSHPRSSDLELMTSFKQGVISCPLLGISNIRRGFLRQDQVRLREKSIDIGRRHFDKTLITSRLSLQWDPDISNFVAVF